ncbi:hypothetical protein QFC21_003136 [Naganishia friedmannii]|uniref:Uncharacterized protein n=1 Tax=Naganishia friedmannii TaxID=89922 RepID=A0ACC2VR49_9TREE|nr:hypothetical protein QFC21_003136 [Naganishia friedmannii]
MAVDQDGFPLQQHARHERPPCPDAPPSYQTRKTSETDSQRQSYHEQIHPATLSYPPAPPITAFSTVNQLTSPDTTNDTPLLRRLSQRLSLLSTGGAGAEYKSYEQLAEEDRTLDAEEKAMLKRGMFNWSEMKHWRFWVRKEWWGWYILLIVCLLFGHEIVMILCGVVWGLWFGFLIVSIGTFLGEMGNFYAFKTCFRARAAKLERKNMNYALLAHVVREGGLKIAVMARLSAIPGHFTTVVFSTCGMSVWMFAIGTILSLPKNLAIVYLGVALGSTDESSSSETVEYCVLAVSFLFSILAAWYIYWYMNKSRLVVWRLHRANLEKKGVALEEIPEDPTGYEVNPEYQRGKLHEGEADDMRDPIIFDARTAATAPGRDGRNMLYTPSRTPEISSTDLPLYPMLSRSNSAVSARRLMDSEMDVTAHALDPYSDSYPSTYPMTAFPQAVPMAPPPGSEHLYRAASDASTLLPTARMNATSAMMPNGAGYLDPPMTTFPVPQPYAPQPEHIRSRGIQLVDPGYGGGGRI